MPNWKVKMQTALAPKPQSKKKGNEPGKLIEKNTTNTPEQAPEAPAE
ncbi:MAG: hypothetical protein U0T56_01425 [Ferruginibacter sp.]